MRHYTILSCLLLLLIGANSCNQNSYSAKRAEEDKLIADFIQRQNIRIIYEEPEDGVWGEKDYLKVPAYDDLYFHLEHAGDDSYTVKQGDKILVRYIRYTLNVIADTARYMTTAEQAYPTEFAYGTDYTTAPIGWHVAVQYMKHSGAACKIICPSKQGLDAEKNTVTPYGYDMQIQIPRY
ncbi:MAG: DUF4827 family protein [Paludibacteraceae bacterium]|nr:DUF4827 family protein [Paludibacteraceae bacterium]